LGGGTAFNGGGGISGAPSTGIGSQNPAFRGNGANQGAFGAQQGQRGFGQQQFNQRQQANQNQRFNSNQQAQQNRAGQNDRTLDRENDFSSQADGSFGAQQQNGFTLGMNNQGAFGLGNGNRGSFFDNQPFNDQGFGQGVDGDAASNTNLAGGNDFGGFGDSSSAFDDTSSRFDDTSTEADRTPGGDFSTSSDLDSSPAAGTGTSSRSDETAGGDPFGITGEPAPGFRSIASDSSANSQDVTTSDSASTNFRASSEYTRGDVGVSNSGDSSQRAFNNGNGATTGADPKTKGGVPVERAQASAADRSGGSVLDSGASPVDATDASDRFMPFDPEDANDQHVPVAPDAGLNGFGGSNQGLGSRAGSANGVSSERFMPFEPGDANRQHVPVAPDGRSNSFQGNTQSGLYRPGGYGFMNQYSGGQGNQAPNPPAFGRAPDSGQAAAGNRAASGRSNAGRSQQAQPQNSQQPPPNYFNGSFSRSRL
jgi:hypothetical protein